MAYYNNYYPQYPYAYPQNQTSYTPSIKTMEWVDGEVGAKAFQMPQGLPPETPIALWDNSEKKIYLKSWNAMGMPNQMQELTYEIKEKTNPALLAVSGSPGEYVTKQEFDKLKEEIEKLTHTVQNANRGAAK